MTGYLDGNNWIESISFLFYNIKIMKLDRSDIPALVRWYIFETWSSSTGLG